MTRPGRQRPPRFVAPRVRRSPVALSQPVAKRPQLRYQMKLLLTNDDGIDAPGLAALAEAATGLGDLAVVAPAENHSICSHRVTTRDPVVVELLSDRRAAVRGT